MKTRRSSLPFLLVAVSLLVFLLGCATGPESREADPEQPSAEVGADSLIRGVDSLIAVAADRTLEVLSGEQDRTLAVYYFTGQAGDVLPISDYLANGLTTEIANRARGFATVVGRTVLDRIMQELSFQAGDLADPDSRLDLGRQLGADLILTGFITPGEDDYRLNAQLVEVETGTVVGGYRLRFTVEESLAELLASAEEGIEGQEADDADRVDQTGLAAAPEATLVAPGTATLVYETFDRGRPRYSLAAFEYFWGDMLTSVESSVRISPDGGIDGSAAAELEFSALFAGLYDYSEFSDTDVQFHLALGEIDIPGDADGIAFMLRPGSFRQVGVDLVSPDGARWGARLTVNAGEWTRIMLPLSVMVGEDTEPPPRDAPLSLELVVPFGDNHADFSFQSVPRIDDSLFVDDVGFFRFTEEPDPMTVEGFDSPVRFFPAQWTTYGLTVFVDYGQSDAGVIVEPPGLLAYNAVVGRRTDASGEDVFGIRVSLEFTNRFVEHLESGGELALQVRGHSAAAWSRAEALRFFIRSDRARAATIEAYGTEGGSLYRDIALSGVFSPVTAGIGTPFGRDFAFVNILVPLSAELILSNLEDGQPEDGEAARFEIELEIDDLVLN